MEPELKERVCMNVTTCSFDHFKPSVTRSGSVMDLQMPLLTIFGSSHFLLSFDWKNLPQILQGT